MEKVRVGPLGGECGEVMERSCVDSQRCVVKGRSAGSVCCVKHGHVRGSGREEGGTERGRERCEQVSVVCAVLSSNTTSPVRLTIFLPTNS